MRFTVRAATFVAAAATIAATAVFAKPSLAWEVDAAPMVPAYTAHAAANLGGTALAVNAVNIPAPLAGTTDFSTPVTGHAEATVETGDASKPVDKAEPETERRSLSALVADFSSAEVEDEEHRCLAGAVYFESKGEPLTGQLAVAEVIINRAKSGRFAKTLCGVVKQRGQFSFIRGGQFPAIPQTSPDWRKAVAIARIAQQDLAESNAPKALFFHARRVSPGWKKLTRVATVGNHVFYR